MLTVLSELYKCVFVLWRQGETTSLTLFSLYANLIGANRLLALAIESY